MASPPFQIGTIVPSTRDLLQAVRTQRSGLTLIPLLAEQNAAREALRNVEEGVLALALAEPGPAMAEAANATRVPILSLRPVAAPDDYLAARAYGADAVMVGHDTPETRWEELAKGVRSTRMFAFRLVTNAAEAARAVDAGTRALVVKAADAMSAKAIAGNVPPSVTVLAWPARAAEADVRQLVGAVDGVIVGVEVYGVTGFERLTSELAAG